MRQAVLLFFTLATAMFLTACGGGSSSSTTTNTVSITPTTMSLNQSDVATVSAQVVDASGTAVSNAKSIVFTSDTPAVATVNPTNGQVCGGTWDASYVVCSPGQVGKATITATSGGLTASATVYVHQKVDRVVINTASSACKSMGQTLQLSATAFSNGTDVTSTVGPLNWRSSATQVASIDSTGILTALAPGSTTLYASISNVTSAPASFTTCAVRSINLHVSGGSGTAFSLASAATQQLAADVVDTAGNTISPTLTYVSVMPAVATVSSSGLVTAAAPGTTSIVAQCATTCNYNLPPVYSNTAVPTVTGSSSSTVYVTGTAATQVIPIDTGANAAGTAIPLPSTPNSIVFAPGGLTAYLGSSAGMMTLDASANTVSQNTALPGKVLAVSPESNFVVVASATSVYVQSASAGNSSATLPIAGATAAAFTPDGTKLFIAAGSTLYAFNTQSTSLVSQSFTAASNDVAVLPSAAFALLSSGAPHTITTVSTCDNNPAASFIAPGTPTALAITPDAAKVLALDSPNIDVLTRTSLAQPGCAPPFPATLSSVDLGQGTFTPTDFVLSSDGAKAYVTSNLGSVIAFDVNANTASTITLANAANGLSEAMTLDGAKLYVGGSDNNVHRIDTANGTDAQQIGVSFKPDLIAVRPK